MKRQQNCTKQQNLPLAMTLVHLAIHTIINRNEIEKNLRRTYRKKQSPKYRLTVDLEEVLQPTSRKRLVAIGLEEKVRRTIFHRRLVQKSRKEAVA